jgi:hypothetical protein
MGLDKYTKANWLRSCAQALGRIGVWDTTARLWGFCPGNGCLRRNTIVFLRNVRRLLVTSNVPTSPTFIVLMKEALSSSETSILPRATLRNITEDAILHSHRRENLKSYFGEYAHRPRRSLLWRLLAMDYTISFKKDLSSILIPEASRYTSLTCRPCFETVTSRPHQNESSKMNNCVWSEVLTAVIKKGVIFWDVFQCNLVFEGS